MGRWEGARGSQRRRVAGVLLAGVSSVSAAIGANVRDSRFEITTYANGLTAPIALEFAPDGRLFVASQYGWVQIVNTDGSVEAELAALFEPYTENENGLLGMALDPHFSDNGYIYCFVTIDRSEQRIYRVVDPARRKSAADAEPVVIRDHIPTRGEFHAGGGLKVGPDGLLYFSVGDNLVAENAQNMNTLAGKIARINLDGSTPADNPFTTASGEPRAVWALGLRNPFRFCFAADGRLFAFDVGSDGQGRREEINLITRGANYGWPLVEGVQAAPADPAYTDPIYAYHEGGAAPTGGVFYAGGSFPGEYHGNLFHLEFVLGRLYRVELNDRSEVLRHTVFADGLQGPVDLAQGPDGSLYYTEIYTGEIKRLAAKGTPSVAAVVAGEVVVSDGPPSDGTSGDETASPINDATPSTDACGFGGLFGFGAMAVWLAQSKRRR